MAVSRGKQFESIIKRDLQQVSDLLVERLYDVTTGYYGQKTPADFIVYRYPHMFFIECKSTLGCSFPFNRLTQLNELVKRSQIEGVHCLVFIWFIEHKKTFAVRAEQMYRWSKDKKSVNIKILENECVEIPARYVRINGKYCFTEFFDRF